MTLERPTIQQTLVYAQIMVKRENDQRLATEPFKLPTRRMLSRLIQEIPEIDKFSARFGRDAARNRFRSLKGQTNTTYPLQRAQIDHTVLDVFVIDDVRYLPIGRPYLTICMDCHTRCILGLYIGFTPPSIQSVSACLKDCFTPKTNIRKIYPDLVHDWPAYGVMDQLVVDGGPEFYSSTMEQICLRAGIEWHASPRLTPWFKGGVERLIGTINRSIAHPLPGTTFRNILEKGEYDPEKHASVTLAELKSVVYKWVVDIYHQEKHRSIHTSPAQMWNSSISGVEIRLPDESLHFEATMGRVFKERRLSNSGVTFEGLYYNSKDLEALLSRESSSLGASGNPKLKVEIRVDEGDIGSVYVLWPKSDHVYKVPAIDAAYAEGMSLFQHKVIRAFQKNDGYTNEHYAELLDAKEALQDMVSKALNGKRKRVGKRLSRFQEGRPISTATACIEKRASSSASLSNEKLQNAGITHTFSAQSKPKKPPQTVTLNELNTPRPKFASIDKEAYRND